MNIYCCDCGKTVNARLTDGKEIYNHRPDLYSLPFWICDTCHNYVGCHHKTKNRTQPLGIIPNKQLRAARQKIHAVLDPLWKDGLIDRKKLYKAISDDLGWKYHTANIRSLEEVDKVLAIAKDIKTQLIRNLNFNRHIVMKIPIFLKEIDGVPYNLWFDCAESMELFILKVIHENAKEANNNTNSLDIQL